MSRARAFAVVGSVLVALATGSCRLPAEAQPLVLATTTSVANSGLLAALADAYRDHNGTVLRSHLVGSGLALRMLESGDADVVISHAPLTEAEFLARQPDWVYRKFMFNDFVLVGPLADPADVQAATSAADAMRRIAQSDARFLSRGDGSGTHEREQQLWEQAGTKPTPDRHVVAGSGMGSALRIASETRVYTLSDRATLTQYSGDLQLVAVFEGGPDMLNTYAVVGERGNSRAITLLDWLTLGRGRDIIDQYRIRDERVFTVWPLDAARDHPSAIPY
jgi:tungstate transport system substrate-binding protein